MILLKPFIILITFNDLVAFSLIQLALSVKKLKNIGSNYFYT